MSNNIQHLENGTDAFNQSMEEYSQKLLKDGWKKESQGYNSLMALHRYFVSTPQEELEKEWAEIEEQTKGIEGPTVEEYFESLNPQAMYAKGYREGAKRYKELLEEFFKGWVAQIREKQHESSEETRKKIEEIRKEKGLPDDAPVFVSPGINMKEVSYHPRSIEDIIEHHILPELQNIYDNN